MSEPRLCRVRLSNVAEGLLPSIKVGKINTIDGLEEVAVFWDHVTNDKLRALLIKTEKQTKHANNFGSCSLIELPNETVTGKWRVWVEDKELEEA